MPYHSTGRLASETASKLGHLDVLKSQFVNEVIASFEFGNDDEEANQEIWTTFDVNPELSLPLVFAVDGSFQIVTSGRPPYREVGFVKTALLRMDPQLLSDVDRKYPHPHKLKQVMRESALYHSTAFPLRGIEFKSVEWMDGVRKLIRDSLKDPRTQQAGVWDTLKWLLYKKWDPEAESSSPSFTCPSCNSEIPGLPYDEEESFCPICQASISVSDIIGLHMEMFEDGASQALANSYMTIHELLLLFSAIRYFWINNKRMLKRALFIKDGPLTLRGQYSKLVPNIREFLEFTKMNDCPVKLIGQEKTGKFMDYLLTVGRYATPKEIGEQPTFAILSHEFIRHRIQRVRDTQYQYGEKTNYGEKVFVKLKPSHYMVLSVGVGEYNSSDNFPSSINDFIGLTEVLHTLPELICYLHEGALIPINLAHGVASLSSYPSAQVLKIFAGLND